MFRILFLIAYKNKRSHFSLRRLNFKLLLNLTVPSIIADDALYGALFHSLIFAMLSGRMNRLWCGLCLTVLLPASLNNVDSLLLVTS